MTGLRRGNYLVRAATGPADVRAAQALRYRCFRSGEGAGLDADDFDARAIHMLIEESRSGTLVACFRLMRFGEDASVAASYSAQFYDLSALESFGGSMVELGRFCIDPEARDHDILRVAWGWLAAFVEKHDVRLLFGCSSFRGTEAGAYLDAFALLKERHLGPKRWLPRVKAPRVFPFARRLRMRKPDLKAAARAMPPLLRSYLALGGWVSDHAVVDRDLGTLHVFTGLETASVPAARARLLRAGAPAPA